MARSVAIIDIKDVNFGWWALAAAFAFIPCAALAIASDALAERLVRWQSPTVLGTFLMLAPWAVAAWFTLRWGSSAKPAQVSLIDDVGVVTALLVAVAIAARTT